MRRLALIWIAACMPTSAAASIPYVYPFNAMTAQEVVDYRLKEPKTQLDYINREKVEAYLNGIKDGAHGREWCLGQPILPHELNIEVVQSLRQRYGSVQLKQNAAPLVVAELSRLFPCKKKKSRKVGGTQR